MRIIKPSFEIWDQQEGLEGMQTHIERCGRVCYKSEPKYRWYSEDKKRWINEDSEEWKAIENPKKEYPTRGENISAKPFVNRMIKSGHGAVLEHGTVYLLVEPDLEDGRLWELANNKYSEITFVSSTDLNYITTNYRVLVENDWLDLLKYQCEPTEFHEKRVTVKFICDRGVSHEFVRHRVFSFAQESTRYCNYSKDKFGNELTFIIPEWCPEIREDSNKGWDPCSMYDKFYLQHLQMAEDTYFSLLKQWDEKVPDKRYKSGFRNNPWTPQQARAVLPNSLKTELVMTGFVSDWKHFFKLRDAGSAHPQARELAQPLHKEFIERNYIV